VQNTREQTTNEVVAGYTTKLHKVRVHVRVHLNIDDFKQTEELQLKVVYVTKSGSILTRAPKGGKQNNSCVNFATTNGKPQPAANTIDV